MRWRHDDCGVDKDDPLALFRGFYGEVLGLWEACLRGRTLADYKARMFDKGWGLYMGIQGRCGENTSWGVTPWFRLCV